MDINRSYFEYQVAVMRACRSVDDASRAAHLAAADGVGRLIQQFQHKVGADAAQGWDQPRGACA